MTRRINLSQVGSYSQEKYEKLLRATVLETDSKLKQASPVDTGRFRMSWQVSENGTTGGMQPAADYDKSEYATAEEAQSAIPIARLGYQMERAGGVYHIHNNLPYAEPLANGHSPQAPAGWTDLIAREMTAWARGIADQIGRTD
jgi:hypothetical protein